MIPFTTQVVGLLEVDAVGRGSQLRLCGRWAAVDASPQLISRWVDELKPLWHRKHDGTCSTISAGGTPAQGTENRRSANHEFHAHRACDPSHADRATASELVTANLDRLACQLQREYHCQLARKSPT